MIRPELKELKNLTSSNHVTHNYEENERLRELLSRYVERKGEKDKKFRIIGSMSSEGGIAIPWHRILDILGFGEWLHLRFHEGYPYRDIRQAGWYMTFHLNTHQGRNPFSKLTIVDLRKVISACKELIQCAEIILTYTRTEGKP